VADPRQIALDVLRKVGRGKFAAPSLDWALKQFKPKKQDAGLITDLVYGTLRRERWLEASLAPLLARPGDLPDEIRWLLRAGAYEKLFTDRPNHAIVNAWVELAKKRQRRLTGLVNAVLRKVELASAPPAVTLGVPDFLYQHWHEYFGDVSWAADLNQPAPLWLTAFPGGLESLDEQGVAYDPGPIPGSVRLQGVSLRELEGFKKGLLQPQNPASLLAAQLLEARPGQRVLDLAGGAGIKAAWLAAAGARVTSYDVNPGRQRAGRKNLERLGLTVEFKTHDLTQPLSETAPLVLLDAPCLGTGTLRGHPELRRRLRAADMPRQTALQTQMLETAAAATEPGGRLLYAVCSLTADEGEGVVSDFLRRHPEFSADTPPIPLPELKRGHGVYVKPVDGLDGFYYARLRRA